MERRLSDNINLACAKTFGKYHVFTGPAIDGDVRGWIWRGTMYLDVGDVVYSNDTRPAGS